jgi:hypothetical protein
MADKQLGSFLRYILDAEVLVRVVLSAHMSATGAEWERERLPMPLLF